MKGDRIKKGLHPDWCDLGRDCLGKDDQRHAGMVSTLRPLADDVRVDIELVRQDDSIPAFTIEGDRQICMRLTNMASCTIEGHPITADTYLSARDALALAHMLESYSKRLDARDCNVTPETIRNEESVGVTA